MIAEMSRITLLCAARSEKATLEELRRLGVLHLEHVQAPGGERLERARRQLERVHRALDVLPHKHHGARPTGKSDREIVKAVLEALHEQRGLEEQLDSLRGEYHRIEPFGAFDPAAVRRLEDEGGLFVRLYQGSVKNQLQLPDDAVYVPTSQTKTIRYFALISRNEPRVEGAEEVRMPEHSLAWLERRMQELEEKLAACHERIEAHAGDRPALKACLAERENRVRFLEARAGMAGMGPVSYLQGFCPSDRVEALRTAAAEHGWGLLVEAPAPEDRVPTLLRNPKWINIIKPVFDFMGIAPGYDEVDISACFLLFFSVFFGMIVGDAGYGLIFLGLTLYFRKPFHKLSPQMVPMMVVMSLCTIAWGLLSGVFFGMAKLPALLDAARMDWLTDNKNVMYVCFIIGAVHLTIAHGWSAWRQRASATALAQVGWVFNTWTMFFVARGLVLNYPFPSFLLPLFLTGVALIALFMTPLKKLKAEAFNHVMLPLNLISNFVDIVSYVRLFAVGLATYAVASAFNGMAIGGGVHGIGAGLVAGVILFVGHAFNIVMAAMGVLVHGIRLNTLEFSGHLGMQWTGIKYNPFALSKAEDEPGN